MSSKIVIFCGKGGVGKTTLSLSFGLKHAIQGIPVLVVTSHPLKELALAVSMDGLSERFPQAGKNLFVVHIEPSDLLAEVVQTHFPVAAAGDRVVRSAIFRNLVEVAPGLKAFYFLSKLQNLAERKVPGDRPHRYDLLIWDAPATGHFLSTLRSAKTFEHYLSGPLAETGAEVARFFSTASNICLFPVTLLEEMASQETVELERAMEGDFQIRGRTLVLNLVSPMALASEAEFADLEAKAGRALDFVVGRGRLERSQSDNLRKTLAMPMLPIPRLSHGSSDLDLLSRLANRMDLPLG
jgi:anion-transporting  ArsA/GET3 family ATPase